MRHLQDFFERYDEILQEERQESAKTIRKLNDEKDEVERNLKKQLNAVQTELDTLQSEIQVKMQEIRLKKIKLANQQIDLEEHQEAQEEKIKLLENQVKQYIQRESKQKASMRRL